MSERLRIMADQNVARVRDAFDGLVALDLKPGRQITADDVREADGLLTRSITRVHGGLLDGSRVRFVGSATIGTDHIDTDYLREHGIAFTSAPGSTAPPVAEWVVAGLLVLAKRRGWRLASKTIGVVGVGNVGERVAQFCEALGMCAILNDPPLARQTGDAAYQPVAALAEADIVTVHTPLTRSGEDATFHLVDAAFLAGLKPGVVLVNPARGPIVDGAALLTALESGHVSDALLDVWEDEPRVELPLLERVAIGTAHIAGHSFDGKVRGTEMLHRALCKHFKLDATWDPWPTMPPANPARIEVSAAGRDDEDVLRDVVLTAYPIERDDAWLRELADRPEGERAAYFDHLRAVYPKRREFTATTVALSGASAALAAKVAALGFQAA